MRSRKLLDRRAAVWPSLVLAAATASLRAQEEAVGSPENPFLKWLGIVLGLVIIWFAFYKGLYPFLLKYFSHEASKAIFWPLVLLYSVTWLHLTAYTLFSYGFYYFWMRVAALFLATLFAIWFLVSFMRRA